VLLHLFDFNARGFHSSHFGSITPISHAADTPSAQAKTVRFSALVVTAIEFDPPRGS